jgi:hypothetical protein
MRVANSILATALICGSCMSVLAVEGPSAAGPIGGTDLRVALLPPPGLYGGGAALGVAAFDFVDGQGQPIPALRDAYLKRVIGGPFVIYVPDVDVLGGRVGFGAFFAFGHQCGRLFAVEPRRCQSGFGDPYLEVAWSRYFGTPRPSRYPGAFPILEGLAVGLGFGVVVPVGQYNPTDFTTQALSTGTNIWDFAPNISLTYTTTPIIAEGTEFSAKFYWNNYLTNPATQYTTGDLLNVDFAVTERIGRFQLGIAGFYTFQVADDKLFGVPIPPDGRRAEALNLGGVLAYDMPEHAMSVKIKGLTSVLTANIVTAPGIVVGLFKKFR